MSEINPVKRIWTPANIVTLIRICLVPVFVVILLSPWPVWLGLHDLVSDQVKSIIAVLVFVIISCTDWLDGYLARSRNEVTNFGKFVDPLADKILVIAALLALIELQVLPSWPVLIILIREFIVAGIRMIAAAEGKVIAASWYGKAKTVTQIIAVVLFMIKYAVNPYPEIDPLSNPLYLISWVFMIIALILTVVSMVDYIAKSKSLFKGEKTTTNASDMTVDPCYEESAKQSDMQSDVIEPTKELLLKLATSVIKKATEKNITIGTAESLTGGLIAAELTSTPGSSAAFKGSVVSYALSVKEALLGVNGVLLKKDGAVNKETALEMALGAKEKLGCNLCVSVTGIAGPGGEEPNKPVGTVFMGLVFNNQSTVNEFHFKGSRDTVREKTVAAALLAIDDVLSSC